LEASGGIIGKSRRKINVQIIVQYGCEASFVFVFSIGMVTYIMSEVMLAVGSDAGWTSYATCSVMCPKPVRTCCPPP
jgi:hypothetical protein